MSTKTGWTKTNSVAVARDQSIWVVVETTRGTLVFPSGSNDEQNVVAAGPGSINQNPSFTDSQEIANTRDITAQFQDQMPAGTWSFPVYPRPSGTLGSVPAGAPLYEALFGVETINGGTSVVYTQAIVKPSISLWMRIGHTVFFASGCAVTGARMNATSKGGVMIEFSGNLMEMGWCGNMTLVGAVAQSATTAVVNDSRLITIGARIQEMETDESTQDDNSGSGYTVTDVDYDTDTITFTPGVVPAGGWENGGYIWGFLPGTPSPLVGTPLESRDTVVKIDTVATNLQSLDWNYNDPVQFVDEISTSGFPTDWMEQARSLNGNINLYFRRDDLAQFKDSYDGSEVALQLIFGDTSGTKLQVDMDQTQLQVPEINIADPAVNLRMGWTAKGSSGEDSCSFTFI